MGNSAWCDLSKNVTILKLHDMCHNPKCNFQKQITFTPKKYMPEGARFKITMKKYFEGSQTALNECLKPAVNVAASFIGMAVSAKTRNTKVGQATTNLIKSLSGGKMLSLIDMNGHGLRLKVM